MTGSTLTPPPGAGAAGAPMASLASLAITLFGPVTLSVGGRAVVIGRTQQRQLLALLALRAPRALGIGEITAELWPDGAPASAEASVHTLVSRLRGILAAAGVDDARRTLARVGEGYRLDVAPEVIDARRFDQLAAHGTAIPSTRRTQLSAALDLAQGTPLADVPHGAVLAAAAAALTRRRHDILAQLLAMRLDAEGAAALLAPLEDAVGAQPDAEPLTLLLMLARYRVGDQAGALSAFAALQRTLAASTGLAPGVAARRLQGELLSQSGALLGCPAATVLDAASPRPGTTTGYGRVPTPVTPLLGRRELLDRVADLLDRSRLVTLTGPGGAGKTRIALETARVRQAHHADGAAVLDLADLPETDRADVLASYAQQRLSLPEEPGRSAAEAMVRGLADARLLLVFDNCEHVRLAAGDLAQALLAGCPGLVLLCTSRAALEIPGEARMPVAPMALPPAASDAAAVARSEAGRLFLSRAAAIDPDFVLTEANAEAVAAVCRRVDGLPLALEIAAARLPLMDVTDLAARLPGEVVRDGGRPPLPGHHRRTLHQALSWSEATLDLGPRQLFHRMAVLPGGSTLRAVATVAGRPQEEVLGDLGRLLAASMAEPMSVAGRRRFRLLEPVRQFALDGIDPADRAAAEQGRRDHVLQVAASCLGELLSSRSAACRADLDGDGPMITAALEHAWAAGDADTVCQVAGGMVWYWLRFGAISAASRWLRRAMSMAEDVEPAVRAAVYAGSGQGLWNIGQAAAARSLTEEAMALFRQVGDDVGLLYARPMHAWMVMEADVAEGVALALDTDTAAVALQQWWAAAGARNIAADGRRRQGALAEAEAMYAGTLAVFRDQLHEPWGQAWSMLGRVHVAVQRDSAAALAPARDQLAQYLPIVTGLRFGPGIPMGTGALLLAAEAAGDLDLAGRACGLLDVQRESMGTDWLAFLTHDVRACRARVATRVGADRLAGLRLEGAATAPEELVAG